MRMGFMEVIGIGVNRSRRWGRRSMSGVWRGIWGGRWMMIIRWVGEWGEEGRGGERSGDGGQLLIATGYGRFAVICRGLTKGKYDIC